MKAIRNLICVAAALFIAVSPALAADREKDTSNKDENGKTVRGPYLTNKFWDNWFIGAGAGFNCFTQRSNDFKGGWREALDVDFGKWFSPEVGLRLGYQGLRGAENYGGEIVDPTYDGSTKETFGFAYIHGDVLVNISNMIGGYRRDRFWNFVPYVHLGYLRLYDVENPAGDAGVWAPHRTNSKDNELAGGVGLLNVLRLADHWNLTLDGRFSVFSGRFHDWDKGGPVWNICGTVGIQYLFNRYDWDRGNNGAGAAEAAAALAAAEAALAAANAANKELEDKNNELADANDGLNNEIERLKNAEPVVKENTDTVFVKLALGIAPVTLFFEKNSSQLNATELQHLQFYVENIINLDPERVFYLSGSADKGTGNDAINTRLSNERITNTIKILKEKYGISEDRLKIKEAKISDRYDDPRLDRSVYIEH